MKDAVATANGIATAYLRGDTGLALSLARLAADRARVELAAGRVDLARRKFLELEIRFCGAVQERLTC